MVGSRGADMRTVRALAVAAAALGGAAASEPAQPDVKIERDGSAYRVTVTAPGVSDPAAGQRLAQRAAEATCGYEPVTLGKYRFEQKRTLDPDGEPVEDELVFTQEFECGLPPLEAPEILPASPRPDDAPHRLAYEYFEARDRGDWAAAWAMFSPGMQASVSYERWLAQERRLAAEAGPRASWHMRKLTWYDNPPGAPAPGRYAAIDYEVKYRDGGFECGYVVASPGPDGAYRLGRHEQGHVGGEVLAKLTVAQLAQVRRDLRCVE